MRNGRERSVGNGKERGRNLKDRGGEGTGRDGTGTESGVRDGTEEEREGTGPGGEVRFRTVYPGSPVRSDTGQSIQAPR